MKSTIDGISDLSATKLKKRRKYFRKLKKGLIEDIVRIEVKIHMICLTGGYQKKGISDFFDKLAFKKYDIDRFENYEYGAFKKLQGGFLTVKASPLEGYLPQCIIETTNPTHEMLYCILKKFPELSVSKAEYTVDIVYSSPQDVRKYFYLIRRYAYFPHVRKKNIILLTHHKNLKRSAVNMSLYAGAIKIYERGKDDHKTVYNKLDKGWSYDDLDRVRIEVTAKREILKKNGLRNLNNFVESVKFQKIFMKRIHFKRFIESAKKVPNQYAYYRTKDIKGHSAALYAEIEGAKKIYKNPLQYLKNVKKFEIFKKILVSHIKEFENNWSKRFEELESEIVF